MAPIIAIRKPLLDPIGRTTPIAEPIRIQQIKELPTIHNSPCGRDLYNDIAYHIGGLGGCVGVCIAAGPVLEFPDFHSKEQHIAVGKYVDCVM